MVLVGKSATTVGGGQPGIRIFPPIIDTGGPAVWSVFMGAIRRDDEDGVK